MDSTTFLTVNEQAISTQQMLKYLQASGNLRRFVSDILRQYVIEQELQKQAENNIDPEQVEQAIIEFRIQKQLSDAEQFHAWLEQNGLDFQAFHNQVAARINQEKLKNKLADARLHEHFIERKIFLDRIVLSRIVVERRELAEELRSQIEEGEHFEQLAQAYSLSEDKMVNGMMGPVGRGSLPDTLRAAVDAAQPGDLIGPLELDKQFVLFRVEQSLPASLEDEQLRELLKNEIFEQWISEKIQALNIQLQMN